MPSKKRARSKSAPRTKTRRNLLGNAVRDIVTSMEEKKWYQFKPVTDGIYASGAGWSIAPLLFTAVAGQTPGILPGTGVSERVGNRIKLNGIDIMLKITPNPNGMDITGGVCRFVVWHDKSYRAAMPSANQLFQMAGGTTPLIHAHYNPTYEHRFTMHQDLLHQFNFTGTKDPQGTASNTAGAEGVYKLHIPAKTVIEYADANGGESSFVDDMWGFAFIADSGTQCCSLEMQVLVRYTDA